LYIINSIDLHKHAEIRASQAIRNRLVSDEYHMSVEAVTRLENERGISRQVEFPLQRADTLPDAGDCFSRALLVGRHPPKLTASSSTMQSHVMGGSA
jgi:hypothetical protein